MIPYAHVRGVRRTRRSGRGRPTRSTASISRRLRRRRHRLGDRQRCPSWQSSSVGAACGPAANKATSFAGRLSATCCSSSYHDGQFWVGLAEHVEGGRYGVARIVFGAEPSDEEILRFVTSEWEKFSFFGDKATETSKPAKNPKRRAREAAKALKRPAVSTKAQQALAAQREAMKRESAQARSRRRVEKADARYEQRKLKRKQKHRGH